MTIQEIYKALREKDLYPDLYEDGKYIVAYVEWGDWKHDHIYLDNVMSDLGYILDHEDETETDGSDCYSSIHYYKKIE